MKAYLIFGMGPAGLFLARQLKRHEDASIVAIGKKDDIGRYSNTLSQFYCTEELGGMYLCCFDFLFYGNIFLDFRKV